MTRFVPDAKIVIPGLPPDFVARPHLRAELDAAAAVTLVCAPAGHGKTMLVADSAHTPGGIYTAWVSLDRDDNDPRRLWSSVTAALATCPAVPSASRLRAPAAWPSWPTAEPSDVLTELLGALAELPSPVRLVLDDVHQIEAPEALHGLEAFVRHRPATVRLVLCSRFDPPIALHRLQLAGRLAELRADRIRFSPDETATMLEKAGVRLTEAQLSTLYGRTDGWAAGIRLATLALAGSPDQAAVLAEFSGNDRSVGDYLVDEVLSSMSADTLEFLRLTSISEPIPVRLAAELTGRDDAGRLLDECERETGLLHQTGRGRDSYRVQPLLRAYLLADLHRHAGPRRVAELHATAAQWCIVESAPVTAIQHAIDGREPAALAEVLRRVGTSLLVTGDVGPLRRGLRAMGGPAVAADPWLSLLSALGSLQAGEPGDARSDLRHAVRGWPDDPPAGLVVLRATAEQLGAAPIGETPGWRSVPADELPAEPALRALACFARGLVLLRDEPDPAAARRELEVARATAGRHGFDYLALQCLESLAVLAAAGGDVRRMRRASAEIVGSAAEHGWERSPPYVGAATMLAFAELLRAEPAAAERRAASVLARSNDHLEPVTRFALRVVHGAALADRGDRAGGLAELQRARTGLGDAPAGRELLAAAALVETAAAMALGHHTAARTAQGWLARCAGDTAELALVRSWAHSAAGRYGDARAEIRPVLDGGSTALLPTTLVDVWLQETLLATRAGDRLAARRALNAALQLAEPLDALRPFAQADPAVIRLLAVHYGGSECDTFAGRALAVERPVTSPVHANLSARELTVLSVLPSLISMDEIAGELMVSVNTVKSHLRSIYNKLDVRSRRTAVLAAYEQGLLGNDRRSA